MKTRSLGSLHISEVGIGCNNFGMRLDEAGTKVVVDAAIDHGVTFFDTSNTYGATQSEVLLGRALGTRRPHVHIATKFGMGLDDNFPDIKWSAAPDYIRSACEASLSRLGTDYIDLYQLHFPDAATPLEDTIAALQDLQSAGKIREFGCSNFEPKRLRDAARAAGTGSRFRSVQNQYSLLHREPEEGVLDVCDELDMGLLPFYPLANGMLTDKFTPGEAPPVGTRLANMPENRRGHWLGDDMVNAAHRVHAIAREHNVSVLTLAFSWLLSHGAVRSVIAGASNAQQVAANVAAVTTLDDALLRELDAATK